MSIATNRTAFVADQIVELPAFPLLSTDFAIGLQPCETGLRLTASSDEVKDGNLVMTYEDGQWIDRTPEADIAASSSKVALWSLLIPEEVRDLDSNDEQAFSEQFMATLDAHVELAELFTTLVTSGWHVVARHDDTGADGCGTPQMRIHAVTPDIDRDRAAIALRALQLPADISYIDVAYGGQSANDGRVQWRFATEDTVAVSSHGDRNLVSINDVMTYALSSAPGWTLRPGIDAPVERHTAGNAMKASVLPSRPVPSTNTKDDVKQRLHAVHEWAQHHDFGPAVAPAIPKVVQQTLNDLGAGNVGYYLLEFKNGDCYLGQSISIAERLKGHRTLRKDIKRIRLRPDPAANSLANPLRHLLDQERTLIHSIQAAGLPARNKAEMTYLSGEQRPLDEIFDQNGTSMAEWLSDPIGTNRREDVTGRALTPNSARIAAGEEAYELWLKRAGAGATTVRSLLWTYMQRCLPLPLHTEHVHWVLSSPAVIPPHRALSNLSIGWTEALRIMIDKNGHLRAMLHVNGVELLGPDMADDALVRFMRQHPGVSVTESPYQAAGPFNLMLWTPDLQSLRDLLDDTAVTRAAATAALHLMRQSRPGRNRDSHNPVLVNAILGVQG
ncbi:GIY-YIG nuclease family protein [Gordonia rhizosphera]|uniref:GIY-YIG domain-containing protein n=1 Tax=Gordonia rhizosphera NBRC 16068 TaxID=1108045 RepID=K6WG52_9ACTN|nr:GIY-YIG nuclease family protein [Gordonia rhizosphera]GAB92746.1 hypothetical protein GORHZ_191_00050 [Gordonia rhizosphera NBRC 16068]